ncbi:hypothetical protein N7456_003320 [Penicillium angulare]|uniref:Uncharacterized protein n=1 Tax=Penicillium angulare TaxID=116970 RepID=A0A9W9FUG1_9EURO|nr:hypothetical protein N7456_003320 [Penicillium angulare]
MKFSLSLAMANLVSASIAAESPLPSGFPAIPKACLEIPQAIGFKPIKLMNQFQQEVCVKNCSATINQHNEFLVNTVFPQIIPDLDKKLDISTSNKQLLNQTRTEAFAAIKKSCDSKGDQPLCNDPQGLFEWGTCAMQASGPIYQKNMKQLAGALKLSESQCEKLKALDSDDSVWNKVIPGYIKQFADQCESNQ